MTATVGKRKELPFMWVKRSLAAQLARRPCWNCGGHRLVEQDEQFCYRVYCLTCAREPEFWEVRVVADTLAASRKTGAS